MRKMHLLRKKVPNCEHLVFSCCGRYESPDCKEWMDALTTDKEKVKCKACLKRADFAAESKRE